MVKRRCDTEDDCDGYYDERRDDYDGDYDRLDDYCYDDYYDRLDDYCYDPDDDSSICEAFMTVPFWMSRRFEAGSLLADCLSK